MGYIYLIMADYVEIGDGDKDEKKMRPNISQFFRCGDELEEYVYQKQQTRPELEGEVLLIGKEGDAVKGFAGDIDNQPGRCQNYQPMQGLYHIAQYLPGNGNLFNRLRHRE